MPIYRVGISIPDGPTMGWNEGGEKEIRAASAEKALTLAEPWASQGEYDYDSKVRVRLTAEAVKDKADRATRVIVIEHLRIPSRLDKSITGGTQDNRATILNKPIDHGGYGRPLTSAERRALRALGWRVSESCIVVRQSSDTPDLGVVYRSAGPRSYNHAGIYVEVKK